jgi:mRNA-degrading endonuclease RelE of RelBE toxin-antitoxin system
MKVILNRIAANYLDRLDRIMRERLTTALAHMEKEPPRGDIRPYEGSPGYWRLRAGGYRAIYTIENETILVTHIEPRGQAYTKKTRGKK